MAFRYVGVTATHCRRGSPQTRRPPPAPRASARPPLAAARSCSRPRPSGLSWRRLVTRPLWWAFGVWGSGWVLVGCFGATKLGGKLGWERSWKAVDGSVRRTGRTSSSWLGGRAISGMMGVIVNQTSVRRSICRLNVVMFVGGCAQRLAVCRSQMQLSIRRRCRTDQAGGATWAHEPQYSALDLRAALGGAGAFTAGCLHHRSISGTQPPGTSAYNSTMDPSALPVCFVPLGLETRRVTLLFVSKISVTVVLGFKTRPFAPQSSADPKDIPCQRPGPWMPTVYGVTSHNLAVKKTQPTPRAAQKLGWCRLLSNHPGTSGSGTNNRPTSSPKKANNGLRNSEISPCARLRRKRGSCWGSGGVFLDSDASKRREAHRAASSEKAHVQPPIAWLTSRVGSGAPACL